MTHPSGLVTRSDISRVTGWGYRRVRRLIEEPVELTSVRRQAVRRGRPMDLYYLDEIIARFRALGVNENTITRLLTPKSMEKDQ